MQRIYQHSPRLWSVRYGPLVAYGQHKNRDGPLIFHRRDGPFCSTGPPNETGPPEGTGPPQGVLTRKGTGPPKITGPPYGTGPPLKKKLEQLKKLLRYRKNPKQQPHMRRER